MTVVLIGVLISFTALQFVQVFHRTNPTVSRTTMLLPTGDDSGYRPQDFGFDFSFGLKNPLDPTIGYFTAKL